MGAWTHDQYRSRPRRPQGRQPDLGRSVQYILLDRPDDADRRRDHDADPPLRRPASAQGLSTIRTRDLSRAWVSLKIEANRVRGFAGPTRDRKPSGMTFLRIVIPLYLLYEHDLRANASRLSRGKTGIHFSGSCSGPLPNRSRIYPTSIVMKCPTRENPSMVGEGAQFGCRYRSIYSHRALDKNSRVFRPGCFDSSPLNLLRRILTA